MDTHVPTYNSRSTIVLYVGYETIERQIEVLMPKVLVYMAETSPFVETTFGLYPTPIFKVNKIPLGFSSATLNDPSGNPRVHDGLGGGVSVGMEVGGIGGFGGGSSSHVSSSNLVSNALL